MKIFDQLIFNLFWPWIDAAVKSAYNEFQQTSKYNYLIRNVSMEYANSYFHENIEDYMLQSFEKNWIRIVFCPWTIVCSNERFER